ncbi:MAG: L28 family ribosomal protein [Patescibacteria group bacterium]
MARTCTVCGRGAMNSLTRSHSNIATKVKQHVNLQTALHGGKRVKACASCIRTETKRLKAKT